MADERPSESKPARGLSRRALLRGGAIVAASIGSGFLPLFARRALAEEPLAARKKTFCFLFLRGALDGLHAVHPYGEPRVAQLRPDLALPPPGGAKKSALQLPLLDLGLDGFGLHASMEPLLPLWREGSLALVHAVGSPDGTRSHFDAQDMLELGSPGRTDTPEGWLSRALEAGAQARGAQPVAPRDGLHANESAGQARILPAVALTARLPRSLQGAKDALAFASIDQLRLRPLAGGKGGEPGRQRSRAAFEALYAGSADGALAAEGQETFEALQLLEHKVGKDGIPPAEGARYPNGPLGNALKQLAQLIKAEVGLRVGCADVGGWDTHAGQPGALDRGLRDLAQALAAFHADLGARAQDVVLIAATEFGRTVRQNGALGTDHGHGSVAFVLGGGVDGGKLHGRWPGLGDAQLYEGRDLAVTTDLRSVLLAGASAQLAFLDGQHVFPGFAGGPLRGLMRG